MIAFAAKKAAVFLYALSAMAHVLALLIARTVCLNEANENAIDSIAHAAEHAIDDSSSKGYNAASLDDKTARRQDWLLSAAAVLDFLLVSGTFIVLKHFGLHYAADSAIVVAYAVSVLNVNYFMKHNAIADALLMKVMLDLGKLPGVQSDAPDQGGSDEAEA